MGIKEYVKRKKVALEEYKRKQMLKSQVNAELRARRLEKEAEDAKKLLTRYKRQDQSKKQIDELKKYRSEHSPLKKLSSGLESGLGSFGGSNFGGSSFGVGSGSIMGDMFGEPPKRIKKHTKKRKKGKRKKKGKSITIHYN